MKKKIFAFVWENFGPLHVERCDAVGIALKDSAEVVGIELGGKSAIYDWENPEPKHFYKVTLFPGVQIETINVLKRIIKTVSTCLKVKSTHVFFCHYEQFATFISAIVLRFFGRKVYVMNDSKYDDYPRNLLRELGKVIFYLPYLGALGSSTRSRDYLRFLGLNLRKIVGGYNSLSIERMRQTVKDEQSPLFSERYFLIVARFVRKKNLETALKAYAIYSKSGTNVRRLVICGSGTLEVKLKIMAFELGISGNTDFLGFVPSTEVAKSLFYSLALILPSIEEQFGNVVIEAQALEIPVILSLNCGARDETIRAGVNGFIVEPDNPQGLAFFMNLLSTDEQLWIQMSKASLEFAPQFSTERFAKSVEELSIQ